MKKINLSKPLLDLDGQPILEAGKPLIMSKLISNMLLQGQSEDPLKMKSLCERIYTKGEVEVDESDYEFFRKHVEKCQTATDMLRGSILQEMTNSQYPIGGGGGGSAKPPKSE